MEVSNKAGINPPALSVIVASYNSKLYIRDCLDSILSQTYKDLEILVCDDCSTDNSMTILREYENQYPSTIKLISNTSNLGVAQTRHTAILQAAGEYLTTLDSDDYYYEIQKLQREMELVLSVKKNTGKDIVGFSNIVLVKGDKTLIGVWGRDNIKEGRIVNEIVSRSCLIPRDFVVKRDIYFELGGYDKNIPIYEDWDLKIRLAHKLDFYYSGVNGTAYRKYGGGLSAAPAFTHAIWLQKIFDKNLPLIDSDDWDCVTAQFNQYILKIRNGS